MGHVSCAMKSTHRFVLIFSLVVFFVLTPLPTLAVADNDLLGTEYGEFTGLGNRDIRSSVAEIIRVALSLLGIIALLIILYAGFMWMTAGGNEEKIGTARQTLWAAVIGLAIILSAYAITNFVFRSLYQATTGAELREVPQTRTGNFP